MISLLMSLEYWPPLARIHWGILSELPSNLPNELAYMLLKGLPILWRLGEVKIPVDADLTAEIKSFQLTI